MASPGSYGGVFTIFSDSKSVLMAIKSLLNCQEKSYLVNHIRDQIRTLADAGKIVRLFWTPAHKGIAGNELADEAAKAARCSGRDAQIRVPMSDLQNVWKNLLKTEFHEWCIRSGQEKDTEYFSKYYEAKAQSWFHSWDLNRRSIVSINHLRSNHNSLRSSLKRFNIVPSAVCSCGTTYETANHVFWQCARFNQEGLYLNSQLQKYNGMSPYSVESFLSAMDFSQ